LWTNQDLTHNQACQQQEDILKMKIKTAMLPLCFILSLTNPALILGASPNVQTDNICNSKKSWNGNFDHCNAGDLIRITGFSDPIKDYCDFRFQIYKGDTTYCISRGKKRIDLTEKQLGKLNDQQDELFDKFRKKELTKEQILMMANKFLEIEQTIQETIE
jgi:hypothetical protein